MIAGATMRARVAGRTDAHDNAPAANAIASAAHEMRRNVLVGGDEEGDARMTDPDDTMRSDADATEARAEPGALYVVATPIGNLRDVTLRALDILRSASIVVAEDTRVTAALLARYGISARARALNRHNEARQAEALLAELAAGRSVALVSDAGTPAVSDPGARLVRVARVAGHRVVPIPGASAITAAISAAGLAVERFAFIGFLPAQAKARRECLATIAQWPVALVFYEAPHRVVDTIGEIAIELDPDRTLVVARELTKRFEQIASMPLAGAAAWFAADANRTRGEFALIVDAPMQAAVTSLDTDRLLAALLDELPPSRAARVAAAATGAPRDALYARALALQAKERRED
jgi:16S rRNA (cytidine1402-2'-O)-methyltransferase